MKNLKIRIINIFLIAIIFIPVSFLNSKNAYAFQEPQRIEGTDRYDTAVKISEIRWDKSSNVIIATGEDFPDALCAAPLAKKLNAPILLTKKADIDASVLKRIQDLDAKKAFIIGGEGVVSKNVQQKLETMGITVTRFSGSDRYDTSLKIALYIDENFGRSQSVFIATGEDFPDALSIAPVSAKLGMPILLSRKDNLPSTIASYIKDNKIEKEYIIGGIDAISSNVEKQLNNAERICGSDRYETNSEVLSRFNKYIDFGTTYIATGNDFPDALTGSALASNTSSPIILTDNIPNKFTTGIINSKYILINNLYLLGGKSAVSDYAKQAIASSSINISGNSLSNINNFGLAAMQGGWVYYSNISDGQRLYKMRYDGSQNQLLLNGDLNISHINAIGDWIYYSAGDGRVYKVKTDGTNKTLVIGSEVYFLYVSDGWIYYYSEGYLSRMSMDGKINQKIMASDDLWQYFITDKYIYYLEGGSIYRTDTSGQNKTVIISGNAAEFNISGNYIYYITQDEKLYRAYIDGSGIKLLTNDKAEGINAYGYYVYYINASDGNSLYRISYDGAIRQKIGNRQISGNINLVGDDVFCSDFSLQFFINRLDESSVQKADLGKDMITSLRFVGDYIYGVNLSGENKITSMKSDGSAKISFDAQSSGAIEISDGFIYYSSQNDGNTIHRINIDGNGDTKITTVQSYDFKVSNGWIYFSNASDGNKLYKVKTDGTGLQMLCRDDIRNIIVDSGKVYYFKEGNPDDPLSNYGIYSINTDGTGETLLEKAYIFKMRISNGYLVYNGFWGNQNKIVSIKLDDGTHYDISYTAEDFDVGSGYIYVLDSIDQNKIARYNADGQGKVEYTTQDPVFYAVSNSGFIYYETIHKEFKLYSISKFGDDEKFIN